MRGGLLVCVLASIGCGEHGSMAPLDALPDAPPKSNAKELTSFGFLGASNPALCGDVMATITGTDVTATVPFPMSFTGLKAVFTTTGVGVTVAGQIQMSGQTPNTFVPGLVFTVMAEDGTTRGYTVHLTPRSFLPKVDIAIGSSAAAVASGDFNGDGKPDLAVSSAGPAAVSVLLDTTAAGATTPTFARTNFATAGTPGELAVADLTGDGKPDLAVANPGPGTVSVFVNTTATGATTPTFAARADFAADTSAFAVVIADFNADGKRDLAVANGPSVDTASVLLNTTPVGATTATFAAKVDYVMGDTPYTIAAGDLDGDGKPDLVVGNVGSVRDVIARINTTPVGAATPSFTAPLTLASGSNEAAYVGDLNADGKPDLLVGDSNPGGTRVYLNTTPTGTTPPTFTAPILFDTAGPPTGAGFADIDGDGKVDVAATTGGAGLSLMLGTTAPGATTPSFRPRRNFGTGTAPTSVAIADFNGDAKPDLAVANVTSGTVSVLLAQ